MQVRILLPPQAFRMVEAKAGTKKAYVIYGLMDIAI